MAPRISIVVPIYNVEPYLAACLESLRQQTFTDLEVVMVDDGSTDASAQIAAEVAARDLRFTLVRQDNHGLGHARNTGVRHAHGAYLAFVDSDDVIPRHTYELMIGTLDETGSDFATGNVHRLSSVGTRQSPMHRETFRRSIRQTHVTKLPVLLYDRLAPNKVWRRSFWDAHDFRFPEGVLYEDIPVTIPAHFLARSVDVIHEPVYLWRTRERGEASITGDRTDPQHIRDRMSAVTTVSRFLAEQGDAELKRRFDAVALGSDLRIFLQLLDAADDDYRALFLDLANDYLDEVDPVVLRSLKAADRLKYHFVRRRLVPELLTVLRYQKSAGMADTEVLWERGKAYQLLPYFGEEEPAVPREEYRCDEELKLRTRVSDIRWENGRIVISGWAYVDGCPQPAKNSARIRVWLRHTKTGRRVRLPVRRVQDPMITALSKQGAYDFSWAGFEAELNPKRLRSLRRWLRSTWEVHVSVRSEHIEREGRLGLPMRGRPQRPEYRPVAEDIVIEASYDDARDLRIKVLPVRAKLLDHRRNGDDFVLTVGVRGRPRDSAYLRLKRARGAVEIQCPVEDVQAGDRWHRIRTRVRLKELVGTVDTVDTLSHAEQLGDGIVWEVSYVPGEGRKPVRLALPDDVREERYLDDTREIVVHRSRYGNLSLFQRLIRPVISEAEWVDAGTLRLAGSYPLPGEAAMDLVLSARDRVEEVDFPVTRSDDSFEAVLGADAIESYGRALPLRAGQWELRMRPRDPLHRAEAVTVKLDHTINRRLPLETFIQDKRVTLTDYGYDFPLLDCQSDLRTQERGRYHQRVLQTQVYPQLCQEPLQDLVLFDSYTGKQYSDSPRVLYEELVRRGSDLEHAWLVRDRQVALPEGARPIRLWGREHYEALARARYIVTNAHLPFWFKRRDGQTIVQTWHGTPLKRIGLDIEKILFARVDYHEKLVEEVANWDYLISPNPFSTPILKRAFCFDGELLETGYPRNDVFHHPDREDTATRVRDLLGVPPGKKVVLYAPTWRDNQFHGRGRYKLDLRLDLDAARAALGDDHVLLIRRHPNVVDTVPDAGGGFVYDVSGYPDVNELLVAVDILVSDYSSIMFDFANTGRPQLFFTYDLEAYRDELRGFYFDFERRAPGPLLATSEEVIDAIRNADAVRADYDERYQAFMTDFCPLDDGKAAARVIDTVFER